jgi:hypothetical protein
MTGGTDVVVSSDESAAGAGLQWALYQADVATANLPSLYVVGQTTSPFSSDNPATAQQVADANPQLTTVRLSILRGIATKANAWARTIVSYVQANAVARVTTSTSCGRTPTPNDPSTAILPPAAEVDLEVQ